MHCTTQYNRPILYGARLRAYEIFQSFDFTYDIPHFYKPTLFCVSRASVVGIATRYGLEGPGIESRWGEIFRTYPHRLQGPPSLLYNGYRVFPGVKAAGA
jgi:hypothetical protein